MSQRINYVVRTHVGLWRPHGGTCSTAATQRSPAEHRRHRNIPAWLWLSKSLAEVSVGGAEGCALSHCQTSVSHPNSNWKNWQQAACLHTNVAATGNFARHNKSIWEHHVLLFHSGPAPHSLGFRLFFFSVWIWELKTCEETRGWRAASQSVVTEYDLLSVSFSVSLVAKKDAGSGFVFLFFRVIASPAAVQRLNRTHSPAANLSGAEGCCFNLFVAP